MTPVPVRPLPTLLTGTPGSLDRIDDDGPPILRGLPLRVAGLASAPPRPGPAMLLDHPGAGSAMERTLDALRRAGAGDATQVIDLSALGPAERHVLGNVLGEGPVVAQVLGEDGLQVRESLFAGVWQVRHTRAGVTLHDTIEVGIVPQGLVEAARADGLRPRPPFDAPQHDATLAAQLLAAIEERQRRWHAGQPPHVVNLSLLPLSGADLTHLNRQLGAGRVLVVVHGPGTCRITNTRLPRTWRVTYFDSADRAILDTLEICRLPEVTWASVQDLEDSAERIADWLAWVRSA